MTDDQLARLAWFEETSKYMDTPSLAAEYLNLLEMLPRRDPFERKTPVS